MTKEQLFGFFFFFEINVSMTDKGKAEQVHNR